MASSGGLAEGERVVYHPSDPPSSTTEMGTVRRQGGGLVVEMDRCGTVVWDPGRMHRESDWAACPECGRQQALNVGATGL